MDNLSEMILNESHIPNNPLREDIVKEVENYIGNAYADDIHLYDYLSVNKNTLKVSHIALRNDATRDPDSLYYNMSELITRGDSEFTYVPYLPAIDVAVLDFFPIDKMSHFISSVEDALAKYVSEHGDLTDAYIGFPIDTFDADIYSDSDIETVDATEEDYLEDFSNTVDYIEVPLLNYSFASPGTRKLNRQKLLILALSNYYY